MNAAAPEPAFRCRGGFTLAETMVAAAVGTLVLGVVLSSFIAAQRMLHTAMAESELSLAMREMRDKLLFKASPDISMTAEVILPSGQPNQGHDSLRQTPQFSRTT